MFLCGFNISYNSKIKTYSYFVPKRKQGYTFVTALSSIKYSFFSSEKLTFRNFFFLHTTKICRYFVSWFFANKCKR